MLERSAVKYRTCPLVVLLRFPWPLLGVIAATIGECWSTGPTVRNAGSNRAGIIPRENEEMGIAGKRVAAHIGDVGNAAALLRLGERRLPSWFPKVHLRSPLES